jgi:hypothetical protein
MKPTKCTASPKSPPTRPHAAHPIPSKPSKPCQCAPYENIKPFPPLAHPSVPNIPYFMHGKFAEMKPKPSSANLLAYHAFRSCVERKQNSPILQHAFRNPCIGKSCKIKPRKLKTAKSSKTVVPKVKSLCVHDVWLVESECERSKCLNTRFVRNPSW